VKIVADNKIPYLRGALEKFAEVTYLPGKEITRDSIMDADALLTRTRTRCNESLLKGTKVRFIGTATIGYDHIDTRYCERNNISWTNAPGCNSSSVQQYIAAALFMIASGYGISLNTKTIGIIGVGNVGSKVARLAEILGMKVLLNDPPRARNEGEKGFVNINTVLREADIITVHVPLTMSGEDRTYHLFDHETFEKLKPGSWFINSSRGEVAETGALKRLHRSSGKLNAIIDVWENEPEIDRELMSEVFIATPHIAGYSADGKANGTAMAVNSLSRYFGLPLNNWYPVDVPVPETPEINIDGTGKSDEEIIGEAVLHTYSIRADSDRLLLSPADFEKQRGDYPLRREFTSYSVKFLNCSPVSLKALEKLGFMIT
jgi:erythronate-4-phosphate dehydrogenase